MQNFESKKRQILERVDLAELVSEHVTLRRSGRRLVGLCPFHSEKTPSFTVSPEQGLFKCFGCGKGGDVFSFLQYRENLPFIEAMRFLADRVGIDLGRSDPRAASGDSAGRGDIARANAWAADFFHARLVSDATGKTARDYLAGRGFESSTVDRFQLGIATEHGSNIVGAAAEVGFSPSLLVAADLLRRDEQSGRTYETFRNRLMFPIRDSMNRVIGFGGRTLGDDRAKYLNTRQTPLFDKGRSLYGIDMARASIVQTDRAVLVEGYTDCIACHQAGVDNVVATLGTAMTESHVQLLRRYCQEVVLLFDSDEAGISAADRAIHVALPACISVKLARIPDGKDPAEFLERNGTSAFSDVLNGAVDALEFKWISTLRQFDGRGSDAKRREAMLDFTGVIAEATGSAAIDAIQLGLIVNQIAHLLHVDRDDVRRMIQPRRVRRRGPGIVAAVSKEKKRHRTSAAWVTVLEVLLNEPALASSVAGKVDLERISDERDRYIAAAVLEAAGDPETYRLSDVLARCRDTADTERVEELVRAGAARGRFEQTLQVALYRLEMETNSHDIEESRNKLMAGAVLSGSASPADLEVSKKISAATYGHCHFGPRRMIRQASVQQGQEVTGVKPDNTIVTEQT